LQRLNKQAKEIVGTEDTSPGVQKMIDKYGGQ